MRAYNFSPGPAVLPLEVLEQARAELTKLARACAVRNWAFTEWLHGKTLSPRGMPGQSWNAAAFLMAEHAVMTGRNPFATRSGAI